MSPRARRPLKLLAGFWLLAGVGVVFRVCMGRAEPGKLVTLVVVVPAAVSALQGTRDGIRRLLYLHGMAALGLPLPFFLPAEAVPAGFWGAFPWFAAGVLGSFGYLLWLRPRLPTG